MLKLEPRFHFFGLCPNRGNEIPKFGRTERQLTNIDTPSEIFKKASDGEKNGVYGDKSKIKLFILGRCGSLGAINRTDTASGREVRAAVSERQIVFDERFAHDFGAADYVLTRGFL